MAIPESDFLPGGRFDGSIDGGGVLEGTCTPCPGVGVLAGRSVGQEILGFPWAVWMEAVDAFCDMILDLIGAYFFLMAVEEGVIVSGRM